MEVYELLSKYKKTEDGSYILDSEDFDVYGGVFRGGKNGSLYFKAFSLLSSTNSGFVKFCNEMVCAEVINSMIYRKLGIESVNYFPAMLGKWGGCVSKDFKSDYPNAQELMDYMIEKEGNKPYNSSLEFIKNLSCLDTASQEFKNELEMVCLADFGLGQHDRHLGNMAKHGKHKDNPDGLCLFDNSSTYIAECSFHDLKYKYESDETYSVLGIDAMSQLKQDYLQSLRISENIETSSIKRYLEIANDILDTGYLKDVKLRVDYEFGALRTTDYFNNLEYYLTATTHDIEEAYNDRLRILG